MTSVRVLRHFSVTLQVAVLLMSKFRSSMCTESFAGWVAHYSGFGTRIVCVRVLPMCRSTQQDSKIERAREREIEGDRPRDRQDISNTIIRKAD